MSLSIILAALWVLAATAVAMLPMRRQYAPGMVLLAGALVLIVWLGLEFGPVAGLGALAAFVSMFRRPLLYFWRRFRGNEPPKEPEE